MGEPQPQPSVDIMESIRGIGWPIRGQVNLSCWSVEEEQALYKTAASKKKKDWDSVIEKLDNGRTAYQCLVHLKTNVVRHGDSGNDWTAREKSILLSVIALYTEDNIIPWGRVASSMPKRSRLQCYVMYQKIIANTRLGIYLPEEDAVILSFVEIFGMRFDIMSNILVGRTAENLTARYNLLIKFKALSTWTLDEDIKLLYIMQSWPNPANETFQQIAEKAVDANANFFPGRDNESLLIRSRLLDLWRRNYPRRELATSLHRMTWRQIQPPQGLVTNLNLAINSLKAKLVVELTHFQDANRKKKSSRKILTQEQINYEDQCCVV